jgi:hypothetical protein
MTTVVVALGHNRYATRDWQTAGGDAMKNRGCAHTVLAIGTACSLTSACKTGDTSMLTASDPVGLSDHSLVPTEKCPRPSDSDGPLYYELSGLFDGIGADEGGGKLIMLRRSPSGPDDQVRGADDLVDRLTVVPRGTRITLVSYRVASRAGSQPPFSCFERS